jgi:NADPH-dependent glutamate synthase beta subunit-like oxidoreductase
VATPRFIATERIEWPGRRATRTASAPGRSATSPSEFWVGVWAAGNVVDPRAQVIASAGAGSAAAIAINADLVQDDVERAVA